MSPDIIINRAVCMFVCARDVQPVYLRDNTFVRP